MIKLLAFQHYTLTTYYLISHNTPNYFTAIMASLPDDLLPERKDPGDI